MIKLYKYNKDFGRMGELCGVFAAEEALVEACMGLKVYFGEVLGKHSDIVTTLEPKDIIMLTDDQDFITQANKFGLLNVGVDPINCLVAGLQDRKSYKDHLSERELHVLAVVDKLQKSGCA